MDENKVKLEHGPYIEPVPDWMDLLAKDYRPAMDFFWTQVNLTQGPGSLGRETRIGLEHRRTRIVVWHRALRESPVMIQAFGAERTLLKAIDKTEDYGPADLQHLDWHIEQIVDDAEREVRRDW